MTVIVIQAWSIVTWFKTYFRWNLWLSVHTVWTHGQEFLGPSQNLPISLRSDGSGLWNIESTYSRLISKAEWEEAIASRRSRFEFFFFVFGSSSFERWNTQSNGIEYIVSSCFILIVFRRMIWRNCCSKDQITVSKNSLRRLQNEFRLRILLVLFVLSFYDHFRIFRILSYNWIYGKKVELEVMVMKKTARSKLIDGINLHG